MERRPRVVDVRRVGIRTTAAGDPLHQHTATIDAAGNGRTTPGPDGHRHRVVELDVLPEGGHRHELTAERAEAEPPRPRRHRSPQRASS